MKKRSVLGIILTIVGVVLVVVAFAVALAGPKFLFSMYQIVAVAVGAALVLIGGCLCSRCGCAGSPACGAEPKAAEQKPHPPKA